MNRRGFLSLMAGAAGAALVPWRGLSEPRIFLPTRKADLSRYLSGPYWFPTDGRSYWAPADSRFSNRLRPEHDLTQTSLEGILEQLRDSFNYGHIQPTHLIVSPPIKHLIDTDPAVRHAAELALGRKL